MLWLSTHKTAVDGMQNSYRRPPSNGTKNKTERRTKQKKTSYSEIYVCIARHSIPNSLTQFTQASRILFTSNSIACNGGGIGNGTNFSLSLSLSLRFCCIFFSSLFLYSIFFCFIRLFFCLSKLALGCNSNSLAQHTPRRHKLYPTTIFFVSPGLVARRFIYFFFLLFLVYSDAEHCWCYLCWDCLNGSARWDWLHRIEIY